MMQRKKDKKRKQPLNDLLIKETTPAGFEPALPREMPNLVCVHIAGHRVNHSAKAPLTSNASWLLKTLPTCLLILRYPSSCLTILTVSTSITTFFYQNAYSGETRFKERSMWFVENPRSLEKPVSSGRSHPAVQPSAFEMLQKGQQAIGGLRHNYS